MLCFKEKQPRQRKIFHKVPLPPGHSDYQTSDFPSNYIRTTKYTVLTFLPLVLFFEVSKISNMYFIIMAAINLTPAVSVFSPLASIFPITLILTISLIKQLIETIAAYLRDKRENEKECQVLRKDGRSETKNFGSLVVGDVVILRENEYVPADCVLLSTSLEEGQCFMETSSLDGEKNLKSVMTVKETFAASTFDKTASSWAFDCSFEMTVDVPIQVLSKFKGHVHFYNDTVKCDNSVELTIRNFLYKGTSVKIVQSCLALVVYTGQQTKIQMNLQRPQNKSSLLEQLINWKVIGLAVIQLVISLTFLVFRAAVKATAFEKAVVRSTTKPVETFFQYLIIMSNLVPISLFVNIELIRLIQGLFMNQSNELKSVSRKEKCVDGQKTTAETIRQCEVNNFTLSDELGRVEFILSDKTGTLTKNKLTLDAIWVGGQVYGGQVLQEPNGTVKFEKNCCQLSEDDLKDIKGHDLKDFKFTFYDKKLFFGLEGDQVDEELSEKYELVGGNQRTGSDKAKGEAKGETQGEGGGEGRGKGRGDGRGEGRGERRGEGSSSKSAIEGNDRGQPVGSSNRLSVEPMAREPSPKNLEAFWVRQGTPDVEGWSDRKGVSVEGFNKTNNSNGFRKTRKSPTKELSRQSQVQKEMVRALVMCHSCMVQNNKESTRSKFSGTSPDEVCILKGIQSLGYDFLGDFANKRTYNSMTEGTFRFEKVLDLEFTSARAMQSIVFFDEGTKLYFMYSKGSDTKIMQRCNDSVPRTKAEALKSADQFSRLGYRTLFFGFRYFTEEEWRPISREYELIKTNSNGAMSMARFSAELLETDLHFLGFIVIQDELQNEVPECIEKLRNAEIKIWVVTGDKFETAITISKSAGIIADGDQLVKLKDGKELESLQAFVEEVKEVQDEDHSIVIDMSNFNTSSFDQFPRLIHYLMKAKSVVCARSSPLVKGQLVALLKKEGKCVLGIGDGENDVNMISEANVGVGVFGKEGTQATKVADFAIGEFKVLWKLVLFYGRINYMRTSNYVIIYMFKNVVVVGIQFVFGFFSLGSGTSLLNPWFLMNYNSFLNTFPNFYLGVFDVDIHYITKVKNRRVASQRSKDDNDNSEDSEELLRPSDGQTSFFIRRIIMENYWILFHESQLNLYFSSSLFWANIVYAALLSFAIVIFTYFLLAFQSPEQNGLTFNNFTNAMSIFLIITVNTSYVLRAKCADVGLLVSIVLLSLLPTAVYLVIFDKMKSMFVYDVLVSLLRNSQFYLGAIIIVSLYVVSEVLFHVVMDEVKQPFYYKLSSFDKSQALSQRLINLKRIVRKRRVYFQGNFKTQSGVSFLNFFTYNKQRLKRVNSIHSGKL
jgi:magnesium-transporting ATPase (P-type)